MEIVVVKVRPSYSDKKLHVLRFLFPDNFYSTDLIRLELDKLFPFGYFSPKIERFMVDFAFLSDKKEFESFCNHGYLSHYLTSSESV